MIVTPYTPPNALPSGDSGSVPSITSVPPRTGQGAASPSASSGKLGARVRPPADARTGARLHGAMRRPASAGPTAPDAGHVRDPDDGVAHAADAARKEGLLSSEEERRLGAQTPSEQLHTLVAALRRVVDRLAEELEKQPEGSRDPAAEARLHAQQATLEALLKVMQGFESEAAVPPGPATGGPGGPKDAAAAGDDRKAHASKEEKPGATHDPRDLQDMMSEFMKMQEQHGVIQGMIVDTFLSQLKMLVQMVKRINEIATSAI